MQNVLSAIRLKSISRNVMSTWKNQVASRSLTWSAAEDLLPKCRVNNEKRMAEVVVRGCNYASVGSIDMMSYAAIVGIIADCRHLAWGENFLDMSHLRSDGMTFIPAIRLRLSVKNNLKLQLPATDSLLLEKSTSSPVVFKDFHAISVPRFDISRDIYFVMRLGHVGSSSFETVGTVLLPCVNANSNVTETLNDKFMAFDYTIFWVYLDRVSRKVVNLPTWFLDKFVSGFPDQPTPSARVNLRKDLLTPSENVLISSHVVSSDMIDTHGHTNYAYYLDFVYQLLNQKRLLATDSIPTLGHLEISYRGECVLGDRLRVVVTQNTSGSVLAHVVKLQGDDVETVVMVMKLDPYQQYDAKL